MIWLPNSDLDIFNSKSVLQLVHKQIFLRTRSKNPQITNDLQFLSIISNTNKNLNL